MCVSLCVYVKLSKPAEVYSTGQCWLCVLENDFFLGPMTSSLPKLSQSTGAGCLWRGSAEIVEQMTWSFRAQRASLIRWALAKLIWTARVYLSSSTVTHSKKALRLLYPHFTPASSCLTFVVTQRGGSTYLQLSVKRPSWGPDLCISIFKLACWC